LPLVPVDKTDGSGGRRLAEGRAALAAVPGRELEALLALDQAARDVLADRLADRAALAVEGHQLEAVRALDQAAAARDVLAVRLADRAALTVRGHQLEAIITLNRDALDEPVDVLARVRGRDLNADRAARTLPSVITGG